MADEARCMQACRPTGCRDTEANIGIEELDLLVIVPEDRPTGGPMTLITATLR